MAKIMPLPAQCLSMRLKIVADELLGLDSFGSVDSVDATHSTFHDSGIPTAVNQLEGLEA